MKFNFTITLILLFTISYAQDFDQSLNAYRPKTIHKVPVSKVSKAKYPVIDMHSHTYANTLEELNQWAVTMNEKGITKTVLLTYATGARFDSLYGVYSKFDQFELWCGIDYTGYDQPNWSKSAIKELIRCHKKGAKGVGEMGDKGVGLIYSYPTPAVGMHIDDPRMQPVIRKCGELGMPMNIHIAEPYWMYEEADHHNDGLMNAAKWGIDKTQPDLLLHDELVNTLENAVQQNPKTTFIACHYANCSYDLSILGDLLDTYPNLYADISARYAETASVPRYTKAFIEKYQDRLLYGTDMGFKGSMYDITFRILETQDEHFYETELFNYHWYLNGLNISDQALKKLYYDNASKIVD